MTIEEAKREIENEKRYVFANSRVDKAYDMSIKSFDAWDEVIKHLKATAKELLDREDEKQSHAFAKGITFAVSMIKNHMKGVENEQIH